MLRDEKLLSFSTLRPIVCSSCASNTLELKEAHLQHSVIFRVRAQIDSLSNQGLARGSELWACKDSLARTRCASIAPCSTLQLMVILLLPGHYGGGAGQQRD